ncbi:uncharacterized protein [Drosophila kikkawai]|uniref:Cyclic nucleotide-binding domain-containing protein n=1 Tax=Drosophila kikkawai TaxID=30033 RepID=A0A6P4IZR6_DROKI|nr:uncharacterized protein LOC108078894 [Drosophila kikkawai]
MAVKRALDAEVIKQKKVLRILRFQKLVRAVIMNQAWLSDSEEQGISMNVKKNVALMRQKRKPGMLTMAEKALMRSNPKYRTIEDRKKLCLLVAGLECFSRIPPKIRARMAPILEFMYVNESRVIIAEGDTPISVYFILNGEVEMKKNVYNKTTKEWTEVPEAIFGAGDCFGDVEMTESCPRMNTYTAMAGCELLAIYDSDYERILKPFMLKQWNEKKMALKAFDYFNFFTTEQIILACKYGVLAQYEPLDTIYLGETGSLGYARFVLSGECVILQCLNMKVDNKDGETTFELAAIDAEQELTMFRSMGLRSRSNISDIADLLASSSSSDDPSGGKKKKQTMRHMNLQDIEKFCGIGQEVRKRKIREKKTLTPAAQARRSLLIQSLRRGTPYSPVILDDDLASEEQDMDLDFDDDEDVSDIDSSFSSYDRVLDANVVQLQLGRRADSDETSKGKSSASLEIFSASSVTEENSSADSSPISVYKDPIETHFIDVGSLTYGSIFGLGEKMEHRVIMARTVVQCLLLPRYWLLEEEQNPGNIWNRRRFYYECNVPSRQDLFTNFLKTRKWNKFRHDYIQNLLDEKTNAHISKEEDIPIMCRIVETSDDTV